MKLKRLDNDNLACHNLGVNKQLKKQKPSKDPNELAASIVKEATKEKPKPYEKKPLRSGS